MRSASVRCAHRRARTVIGAVLVAALAAFCLPSRAFADESQGTLTPCLMLDAAGGPVYPTTTFLPSGKEMVAAFALAPDAKVEKLSSRWIAVDVGDAGPANTKLAEKELDLKGKRSGMLRYSQTVPLPVGTYRLEVTADGQPWKTVDLTVAAPKQQPVERDKSAPLFDLSEGKTFDYALVATPAPGASVNIPNAKPGADGVVRADLLQKIGKADENGIPIETAINGQVVSNGWLKNDGTGLYLIAHEQGDKPVKLPEPHTFIKLPVDDGMEWTFKRPGQGADGQTRVWGPLPVEGPDGPAPGWIVVSKELVNYGKPGTSSVAGEVTTERHFLPGYGMVKEVRTSAIGGKLDSRQEVALKTSKAFEIVANPKMKGRLGRMVFKFPADTKASNTPVAILKGGAKPKDKAIHSGYGNESFDLLPGTYAVVIAGKLVDGGQVKSAHETFPIVGVLRLNADNDTSLKVLDADQKTEVYSGYGAADVGLPIGTYYVEVAGQKEEVKVEPAKVTEF